MFQWTPSILASAVILLLFYLLFLIFQPFITALVLSGVIVILFYPIHTLINRKISNGWASLISTLLVFIIIIVPGLLIATSIIYEAINLSRTVNIPVEKIMLPIHSWADILGIDLPAAGKDAAQKITSQAGLLATYIVSNIWNILIGTVVTLLATFFFFRDAKKVMPFVKSLPINSSWSENLIEEIVIMIKTNITASFVAASLQGIVGGITFAGLGLSAPILWGTIMGFFSLFPFIGSWLIWIPTAIVLALTDQLWKATVLLIIGLVIVNPIDNILRPAMVASSTNVNGLLIFIGLLGGVQAFGIAGLLFGPVLVIIVASFLRSKHAIHNIHQ
jgi:predicted PurR-regulated permease PerM